MRLTAQLIQQHQQGPWRYLQQIVQSRACLLKEKMGQDAYESSAFILWASSHKQIQHSYDLY